MCLRDRHPYRYRIEEALYEPGVSADPRRRRHKGRKPVGRIELAAESGVERIMQGLRERAVNPFPLPGLPQLGANSSADFSLTSGGKFRLLQGRDHLRRSPATMF